MKKKLMFLALGVVAACSAFAQINVNEPINGNTIVGQVTNVNPGASLTLGTMITFVSGGTTYTYSVVNTPSTNPSGMLSDIANAINNAFNTNSVSGAGGPVTPNRFGSNAGEYSVNFVRSEQIPFDLGLSAVLGAGAIAAVKRARQRRKSEEAKA